MLPVYHNVCRWNTNYDLLTVDLACCNPKDIWGHCPNQGTCQQRASLWFCNLGAYTEWWEPSWGVIVLDPHGMAWILRMVYKQVSILSPQLVLKSSSDVLNSQVLSDSSALLLIFFLGSAELYCGVSSIDQLRTFSRGGQEKMESRFLVSPQGPGWNFGWEWGVVRTTSHLIGLVWLYCQC